MVAAFCATYLLTIYLTYSLQFFLRLRHHQEGFLGIRKFLDFSAPKSKQAKKNKKTVGTKKNCFIKKKHSVKMTV